MGNNHYVMQAIADRTSPSGCKAFVGWLLSAAKGYAAKMVNPGGVEVWKQQARQRRAGSIDVVDHFDVTPRQIIRGIAQAADELACRTRCIFTATISACPATGRRRWKR